MDNSLQCSVMFIITQKALNKKGDTNVRLTKEVAI